MKVHINPNKRAEKALEHKRQREAKTVKHNIRSKKSTKGTKIQQILDKTFGP